MELISEAREWAIRSIRRETDHAMKKALRTSFSTGLLTASMILVYCLVLPKLSSASLVQQGRRLPSGSLYKCTHGAIQKLLGKFSLSTSIPIFGQHPRQLRECSCPVSFSSTVCTTNPVNPMFFIKVTRTPSFTADTLDI